MIDLPFGSKQKEVNLVFIVITINIAYSDQFAEAVLFHHEAYKSLSTVRGKRR